MTATKTKEPPGRSASIARPRRRRWWVMVSVVAAGSTIMVGLLYRRACDPQRIRLRVENGLRQVLNARVALGGAAFSWVYGVRLFDLRIDRNGRENATKSDTGRDIGDETVLVCRELRVTKPWWSWLTGDPAVDAVIAMEPMATVDLRHQTLDDVANLLRIPPTLDASKRVTIPFNTFELRRARLRAHTGSPDSPAKTEELLVTLRALRSRQRPDVLDVVWQDEGDRSREGYLQLDLSNGELRHVRGGTPWLSARTFASVLAARRPSVRDHLVRSQLEGRVWATDFRWIFRDAGADSSFVTLEVGDLSAELPSDRMDGHSPSLGDEFALKNGAGRVEWKPGAIHAELTGSVANTRVGLTGDVRFGSRSGSPAEPECDLSIRAADFPIPRRDQLDSRVAELVERSRGLATFYRDFDPAGQADVEVQVTRESRPDAPFKVRRLVLTVQRGEAVYRSFPYPLKDLTGVVEYSPEAVEIRRLTGRRHGATVTIDGRVSLTPQATFDRIEVRGVGVPIDDALWKILPESMATLRSELSPHGNLDIDLVVTGGRDKPEGPRRWNWEATTSLREVSLSGNMAMPSVNQIDGMLKVSPGRVELCQVVGRIAEGRLQADAVVSHDPSGITRVQGDVRATDVIVDQSLLENLPAQFREPLQALHPAGSVDVSSVIAYDSIDQRVSHRTDVAMKGVTIRPEQFPLSFTDVVGQLNLVNDQVQINGVTAKQGDSTWSAEGTISFAEDRPTAALTLRAQNMRWTDQLRDALRPTLGDVSAWNITGPFEIHTTLRTGPADSASTVDLRSELRFTGISVAHPRLPLRWEAISGEIVVQGGRIIARDVVGRYGPATVRLNLEGRTSDGGVSVEGSVSAVGLPLENSTRDLLPERLRGEWDRLQPGGAIDVEFNRFVWEQKEHEAAPTLRAEGRIRLNNVKVPGAVGIDRASGEITGAGTIVDSYGSGSFEGEVNLDSLTLLDRQLEQIHGRWAFEQSQDGQWTLAVRSVDGRIYDGRAMAEASWGGLGAATTYQLSATVHEMQIKPFIDAGRRDGKPTEVEGRLDGQLHLSGTTGDVATRRGGGRFEIGGGRIQQLPIIVAILQVLNLSLLNERMIDRATADFFITGPAVNFHQVRLQGGGLLLVGSGTMSLPDRIVDLSFQQTNPPKWAIIPGVADLVNAATRELVEIRVTGSLERPIVRTVPLGGLRKEIRSLLQPKKSK